MEFIMIPQFVSSSSPLSPAVSKSPHGIAMKAPFPTWIGIIPIGFVTCESGPPPHKSQINDGAPDGVSDGTLVDGDSEGTSDGHTEGNADGRTDGTGLGCSDGRDDGLVEGTSLGDADGTSLGTSEGGSDGKNDGASDGDADGLELGESDGEAVGLPLGVAEGFGLGAGDGASLGLAVVGALVVGGVVTGPGPVPPHLQIQRKIEPCSGRVTPQKQQTGLNPPPMDDGGTADGATGAIGASVVGAGGGGPGPGPGPPPDPGCRHVQVAEPPVGGGSAPQIHVGKPRAWLNVNELARSARIDGSISTSISTSLSFILPLSLPLPLSSKRFSNNNSDDNNSLSSSSLLPLLLLLFSIMSSKVCNNALSRSRL
mmetsp:Transcript_61272/g.149983  ORF Transcript_61272/g.149983 Transcript_61272/m.149983 type:complete len:370 (-) Transcript_61272:2046-3155(-)